MRQFSLKAIMGVALLTLPLGGCGVSKAIGAGKDSPDEFAIATKAPLVVPPDYALRPPKPGETRPQEQTPTERAQQVLLGDTSAAPPTAGEQLLLQKSGAFNSEGGIRQLLAAENGSRGDQDRSLANQLLFWNFLGGDVDDSAAPLRVEDPEAWLADRRRSINSVIGEEDTVKIEKSKTLGLPGIF